MTKRRILGFSLVEILVSLTVFGLVMAAAGVAFISIYKNWQRQRDYLQCIENARWAMEFVSNEARKGGIVGAAAVLVDNVPTLRFEIDTNGDYLADTRIWYWRGNAGSYGRTDVIYRGLDNPPMNSILVPSLRDEARLNREELVRFITPNPVNNNFSSAGGGLYTIEITVRPNPASPAGPSNRDYTFRTQVRVRN